MVLGKLLITSATLKLVEVSLHVYEHEVDTVSIPHQYYRLFLWLIYGTFVDFCLSCVVHQQSLLADEQLASCPVLLLGNKIDIPGAASEDYIRQYFGLYGLTTGKVQD